MKQLTAITKRRFLFTFFFFSLSLLLIACGSPPPVQVAGQWTGKVEPSGVSLSLELTQEESSITGSAELGPLEFDVNGQVNGATLTLNYTERGESIDLAGRVSGPTYVGTITTSTSGEVTSSGTFNLERQTPETEE